MTSALALEGVSKRYDEHVAVSDLSLRVTTGTIFGILGPNGAGKSTTLRMAMNIIARDQGTVSLLGKDPAIDRDVLRRVGYLPEERGLYKQMTVLEVIVFFGALKGMAEAIAKTKALTWIDRLGLGDWRSSKVQALSKGMQQKVQFITTVVHEPDLLILDEPGAGLDPVNQQVLRETILETRAAGRTVILSTHSMVQAEELCDQLCIIAGGRKVLEGSLRELKIAHRGERYAVRFEHPSKIAAALFHSGSTLFSRISPHSEGWDVDLAPGRSVHDALTAINALNVPISSFHRIEPTLHEIFVHHVGAAAQPARREEVAHA